MDDRIIVAVIIGGAILLASLIGSVFKTVITLAIPLYILYLTVMTYKAVEDNKNLSDDDKDKIQTSNKLILSLQGLWILVLAIINLGSIRKFFGI